MLQSRVVLKDNLSQYQVRTICSVEALSECRIPPDEVVRRCFEIIRTTIAFQAAAFFFLDAATGKIVGAVLENLGSRYLAPLLRCMWTKSHSSESPVVRGSDVSARCVYRESGLLKTVLEPNRLGSSLISTVRAPDGTRVGQFCLWRAKGRPNFSKVDIAFVLGISAALGRALHDHRSGQNEVAETQSLLTLVEQRSQPGILIVDDGGKLISANREARDLIELLGDQAGQNGSQPGFLPQQLSEMCRHLREHLALKGKGSDRSPESDPLSVSHIYAFGGEKFSLRGAVLETVNRSNKPHFFVLIERISLDSGKFGRTAGKLGLSPREIGVVKAVLLGQANKEIANTLGIAEHTVKGHLKKIMTKLHVTSRTGIISAIVQMIDSGPAVN